MNETWKINTLKSQRHVLFINYLYVYKNNFKAYEEFDDAEEKRKKITNIYCLIVHEHNFVHFFSGKVVIWHHFTVKKKTTIKTEKNHIAMSRRFHTLQTK